jgi:hypothetical protein
MQKETIKYSISLFLLLLLLRLQKEKLKVDKAKQEHIFTNYALGFGNYRTLNAELFVNQELNNDYGAMFRHLSSQGGIWCGVRRSVL